MQRRRALALLTSAVMGTEMLRASPTRTGGQWAQWGLEGQCFEPHVAWVGEVLTRMQTIKPGMPRLTLLSIFTTEGGLATGLRRTYVSRDCPYFKVDVEFRAVGRPDRDKSGVTLVEGDDDIVVKISRPYLEFSVFD
jgi:hypothetical protein